MSKNLFQLGQFFLHSRGTSEWKIDCDALTDEDLRALTHIVSTHFKFCHVVGVPEGGLRFADALRSYATTNVKDPVLIVDDVLTTGSSMTAARKNLGENSNVIGVVIFSRGKSLDWVTPIFQTELL